MNLKHLLVGAVVLSALSSSLYPAVIFDNADAPLFTTSRISAIEGVAAYLQVGGSNVAIGQIAINAQPLQNGQLRFVIFSDIAPPGSDTGTLLFSDTINVSTAGSLSYILSDPFSFTLQAGQYYDIGAVFSGTGVRYTYDLTSDSENGVTSIVANENVDNFVNPALAGHGISDINIQLYSPNAVAPEPATNILSVLGFTAIALASYWRQRRSNIRDC